MVYFCQAKMYLGVNSENVCFHCYTGKVWTMNYKYMFMNLLQWDYVLGINLRNTNIEIFWGNKIEDPVFWLLWFWNLWQRYTCMTLIAIILFRSSMSKLQVLLYRIVPSKWMWYFKGLRLLGLNMLLEIIQFNEVFQNKHSGVSTMENSFIDWFGFETYQYLSRLIYT